MNKLLIFFVIRRVPVVPPSPNLPPRPIPSIWNTACSATPAIGGEWPADAIRKRLEHLGENNFDSEEIIAVKDGTRDGHLEFMVPLVEIQRIPLPSVN
jgi:hypothetical protein